MIDEAITPQIARMIIEPVGGPGEPPEYGQHLYTVGLEPYLSVIDEEYLSTFIRAGGSAFKMVVGVYGGGKTHFLYCVRDLAWKQGFAVSYVSLTSGESPFHRLDSVYRAIVRKLCRPLKPSELLSGYETGIQSFLQSWYARWSQSIAEKGQSGSDLHAELQDQVAQISSIESISFANAVRNAFLALLNRDDERFMSICQWLNGEGYDRGIHGRHGILQRLDRTTAPSMLRSLAQWIRQIGCAGLVVLLDEAERVPSLSTKQRDQHLSNLRELIDECGHTSFQGVMILYAVPDEGFLEGRTQIYEALRQRVATVFAELNPTGVKIELERTSADPILFMCRVGEKLAALYEKAYDYQFESGPLSETARIVAERCHEQRFGDIGYRRLFVQRMVRALRFMHRTGRIPTDDDLEM